MEKKVEIMPRMRDLKKGKKVEFPIDKVCTVRNNVSLLNAQGYKMDISGDRKLMYRKGLLQYLEIPDSNFKYTRL